MPLAVNHDTGEVVYLTDDGQWQPAKRAVNPQTKEMLAFDGKNWETVPSKGKGVMQYVTDTINSLTGGTIEGVPILGPTIKRGAQRAAAGIRSVMSGKPYADELKTVQDYAADAAKEHPAAETVGEVAGGIGSMAGLGATATGARLLGLTGESLPGMMARSAASGTVVNAADAAARGDNPVTAASVGGVIGLLAPAAGRAVSTAGAPLVNAVRGLRNPTEEASRRVATALERDLQTGNGGLSSREFAQGAVSGEPVMLMDAGGETTRALARSAANTSSEGRAILNRAIDDRFERQGDRVTNWLQRTFNYPDAVAQRDALDQVAKTVNGPAYRKAYEQGANGLWSPELERLAGSDAVARAMQSASKNARDEAIVSGYGAMNPRITFTQDGRMHLTKGPKGVPTYPDLQFWDLTRRELTDAAMKAPPGSTEARRLKTFASSLNAELDRLVPSYREARTGASAFFGAEDAMDAGQKAVSSRMTNSEIRKGLAKMSPVERQLFQDGFVDRYVQMIREMPDRRSVLNQIATSPAARERLSLALGSQKAKELEAMLRVEGVMDLARSAVQGNSTTARQLAELGLAGGVYGYETGGNLTADPAALTKAALVYGAARGHRVIDERVAREVARLLTSQDATKLAKGIKLLARNQTMMKSIRQADAALASIAARGALPAISGPAAGGLGLQ